MMKTYTRLRLLYGYLLLLSACTSLQETSKYEFQSAKYYTSILPGEVKKVYLAVEEDSIRVFTMHTEGARDRVDPEVQEVLSQHSASSGKSSYHFYNPSFDVDLLTTPFKYRFAWAEVPRQLNSVLNASTYLGYRNDIYRIKYKPNLLGNSQRNINHLGTSLGLFAGLGSEPINPWVTQDQVSIEYDGVVFNTGMAWILAFNNVNAGVALGLDYLLDSNHQYWIYQQKPWLGLTFGLNLN